MKPTKPYPDFPLFPHATGRWAKKIRGKLHYFGPWRSPDAALALYLSQREALHTSRLPRDSGALSIRDLVNQFLAAKDAATLAGEITKRTRTEYGDVCDFLIEQLGKRRIVEDVGPEDFGRLRDALTARLGPTSLGNMITRVRVVFKFAADNALIPRPIVYGSAFRRPSAKTLRLERATKPLKLFTNAEVLSLLAAAGPQLRAMILLGINCGLGNADVGRLQRRHVVGEWLVYPRPKTGINRRAWLWPETLAALQFERVNERDDLIFVTKYGGSWAKDDTDNPVSKEFAKLVRRAGVSQLGFYALRHTFRTIADEVKDQPAVDFVMGHEVPGMSSRYRERIGDDRLKAIADHVWKWLFG